MASAGRLRLSFLALILVLATALALAAAGFPEKTTYGSATFVVNSTLDDSDAAQGDGVCDNGSGACTLRAAIQEANIWTGHDTIAFAIGTGPQTIMPTGAELSPITDQVTIDGTTQPCDSYPCIELVGTFAGDNAYGLQINAGNSTVRGLVINRFGGSGFGGGIRLDANGTLIEGNYIGTDVAGNIGLADSMRGMMISSDGNTIQGNVVSGSPERGILIFSGSNTVTDNRVGTNASGTAAIPNDEGIEIQNGSGNTIDYNIISGNTSHGIDIAAGAGFSANNNLVFGNRIGTGTTSSQPIPNGTGILIEDYFNGTANGNVLGSAGADAGNTIAYNAGAGIAITGAGATGNPILSNSLSSSNHIYSNGGLGIDLGDDGVTANDAGDADTGPNGLQNYPQVTGAHSDGLFTYIDSVSLNSTPNTTFTIEFFASESCDSSDYGEGMIYVGATGATTDGSGDASFNISFGTVSVPDAWQITATATDPTGNTSEFSKCTEMEGPEPTPSPTPSPTATPTPTPTSTPTPTPSPTPTPTPVASLVGDADCSGVVDAVDALWVLRFVANLGPFPSCIDAGNVGCDDAMDAVDALFILRWVAHLPYTLPPGCGAIGS